MKRNYTLVFLVILSAFLVLFTGCDPGKQTGEYIIDAVDAVELVTAGDAVLVDAQASDKYREEHCDGAVNISRANIVINKPYPNMLAPAGQIEEILSARGISPDTQVVIYDGNKNMDSARLWWTLLVYGHDNAKVVSGGLDAMKGAGMPVNNERVGVARTDYIINTNNKQYIASTGDVKVQVDNPQDDVCIIDTRTEEEYTQGTIPGSLLIDFQGNNFKDGTYKPVRQIRIKYDDMGVKPKDTVILFCKTSVRGAQTFLALYNAGYRNLKLYDAAWVGWSADSSLPVQVPSGAKFEATVQDGS